MKRPNCPHVILLMAVVSYQAGATLNMGQWDEDKIVWATLTNNTELIEEALNSSLVDANAKVMNNSMTWLCFAIWQNWERGVSEEVVRLLIDHNAHASMPESMCQVMDT